MKIASWNVNSLRVRLPHVLDWLAEQKPDVLGLQETKVADDKFPADEIRRAGYRAYYAGQSAYNGVALLCRAEATEVATDVPGLEDPQRRILGATIADVGGGAAGVRVLNLYVVNGKEVGDPKYDWKLHWLEKIGDYIEAQLGQHDKFIVLGDFNIAPEDADVHDPDEWRDKILCSAPERAALQRLFDMGLVDTFRLFKQPEKSYSWWDYRAAAFRRNMGLRIDLILASKTMAAKCASAAIDKTPRKLERPSDHAPVVAEFE